MLLATLQACKDHSGEDGVTQDLASKYEGTWTSGCFQTDIVEDATTGDKAHVKRMLRLEKISHSKLTFEWSFIVYSSNDTACQAMPMGAIESTGLNSVGVSVGAPGIRASNGLNIFEIEGISKLGVKRVERIIERQTSLTRNYPASAKLRIGSKGGFVIHLADFQAKTSKNIAFQSGNTLIMGRENAATYPKSLGKTPAHWYEKKREVSGPPFG